MEAIASSEILMIQIHLNYFLPKLLLFFKRTSSVEYKITEKRNLGFVLRFSHILAVLNCKFEDTMATTAMELDVDGGLEVSVRPQVTLNFQGK
jgi:hypothetical protein